MIGSSKNNRENYPRKCFRTQEQETRVKFNPGLSANRPSNNWAQGTWSRPFEVEEMINSCWWKKKIEEEADVHGCHFVNDMAVFTRNGWLSLATESESESEERLWPSETQKS